LSDPRLLALRTEGVCEYRFSRECLTAVAAAASNNFQLRIRVISGMRFTAGKPVAAKPRGMLEDVPFF
jgi:hypothetical protein